MLCRSRTLFATILLVVIGPAIGANLPASARKIDNADFRLVLIPRTPEQMAAFYEARGFPKPALQLLRNLCFITIGFKNKSRDIIWLNLDKWYFYTNNSFVQRIHRSEWPARWKRLELPKNLQATFRWTLLPETLDFRPQEEEGGNIILPRLTTPITLVASFPRGRNKQHPPLEVTVDKLSCAVDPS
ncbi:MAG: hypothetical protein LJE74_01210 [Proteobacteria bacterium]|jgi:hypothetical protein|nr:hypothetical protein [Pseudomonadota bacterium]